MPDPEGKQVDLSVVTSTESEKPTGHSFKLHIQGLWEDRLGQNIRPYLSRLFKLLDKFIANEPKLVEFLENMSFLCKRTEWEGIIFLKTGRLEAALYIDSVVFRIGSRTHVVQVDPKDLYTLRDEQIAPKINELAQFMFSEVSRRGEVVRDFPLKIEQCWQHIQDFNPRSDNEESSAQDTSSDEEEDSAEPEPEHGDYGEHS